MAFNFTYVVTVGSSSEWLFNTLKAARAFAKQNAPARIERVGRNTRLFVASYAAKVETVRDARQEKLQADALAEARDIAAAAPHKVPANLDPRIGVLQRAQGVAFYATIDGKHFEASPERLVELLDQTVPVTIGGRSGLSLHFRPSLIGGSDLFDVKLGCGFLANISFDGPRGTIITHEGALRADERKLVYSLHEQWVARLRQQSQPVHDTLCGAPKDV